MKVAKTIFKNSLIYTLGGKHKGNVAVKESLFVIKIHVSLHKTSALIFSA